MRKGSYERNGNEELNLFVHIIRRNNLIIKIFESTVLSKEGRDRRRKKFLEDTYIRIECGIYHNMNE